MKKLLFCCAVFVATSSFAQEKIVTEPIVQHSGILGYASPYFPIGYDARFRTFEKKADFAVGADLLTSSGTFGINPHIGFLFGKGSSALELGLHTAFLFTSSYSYSNYQSIPVVMEGMDVKPFIGYRYQPANKHFFLQFQHNPFIWGTYRVNTIELEHNIFIKNPNEEFQGATSFMYGNRSSSFLDYFSIRMGFNLNRVEDTATQERSAYESSPKKQETLQHSLAIKIGLANAPANLGLLYDLRFRYAHAPDVALNIAYDYYGLNIDSYARFGFTYAGTILFGKGKACFETGLDFHSSYYVHSSGGFYDVNTLGLPIGFRYQPRSGFFMRMRAVPAHVFLPTGSTGFLSMIYADTSFGYSF